MAFKRFTGTGKSFSPRISINSQGRLGLNDSASQKFEIAKYGFCVLFYDEDERKIGMQLTSNQKEPGAIKIRLRATGASVGIKSFLDYFDIQHSATMMYDAKQHGATMTYDTKLTSSEGIDIIVIFLDKGRERKTKQ